MYLAGENDDTDARRETDNHRVRHIADKTSQPEQPHQLYDDARHECGHEQSRHAVPVNDGCTSTMKAPAGPPIW